MTISFLIEGLDTCKSNYKPDEFRGIVILCVSTSALMSLQQDCNVNSRRTVLALKYVGPNLVFQTFKKNLLNVYNSFRQCVNKMAIPKISSQSDILVTRNKVSLHPQIENRPSGLWVDK